MVFYYDLLENGDTTVKPVIPYPHSPKQMT